MDLVTLLSKLADPREIVDWMRFGLILGGIQCIWTIPSQFPVEEVKGGRLFAWRRLHGRVYQTWLWSWGGLAILAQLLHWFGLTSVPRSVLIALVRTTSGVFDWRDIIRYSLMGIGLEGFFTSIADWKPAGHSSVWYCLLYWFVPVWMTVMYSQAGGLEERCFLIRGAANTAMILTIEFLAMGAMRISPLKGSSSEDEYWKAKDSLFGWGLTRKGLIFPFFVGTFFYEFSYLAQLGRLPALNL